MKTAVVLFNLGGPDELKNIRPFLFNLFSDPAILELPALLRLPLAALIAALREKTAREIYAAIGGSSPLLACIQEQARALDKILGPDFKTFIAMRYARPRANAVMHALTQWGAEQIVLLPMYPQFSKTTTSSSFRDFQKALEKTHKTSLPVHAVDSYPTLPGFIQALAERIHSAYEKLVRAAAEKNLPAPRLLLSAHGLPKKMVERGDPYAGQCEESAAAAVAALNIPNLDWRLCYQSRVGPLEWLTPYTEEEIKQAGAEKRSLLIAPLAFTADNSETLYEIDMLYRNLARDHGVPLFASVPCVGAHPAFIGGLADLVRQKAG